MTVQGRQLKSLIKKQKTNRKQNLSDIQLDTHDPYPQFLKTNGNLHIRGALIMLTATGQVYCRRFDTTSCSPASVFNDKPKHIETILPPSKGEKMRMHPISEILQILLGLFFKISILNTVLNRFLVVYV